MDPAEGETTNDTRDEGASSRTRGQRGKVSDGIRQGLGVLSALKDALEETIQEVRDRGDLSPERAREALRSAMARAQEAAGEARERIDFVTRVELDELKGRVTELGARLERVERKAGQVPPDAGTSV